MSNVYAVILAGGSGTRFWPASRRLRPKQLLAMAPSGEQTLIGATVARISELCSPDHIFVATGAHLLEATREALPQLPRAAFLGEPAARNTAPCIGWASSIIARRDPDAVVMVLPSDHHIGDVAAFRAALERALRSAESGPITTIGIRPTRAETGYGYIEMGAELGGGVHVVARFVEKPDRARAEQYLQSGRFLWNSGMFFFRAARMRAALTEHAPELALGLDRIERAHASGLASEQAEIEAVFPGLPSISIDYAVMEKEPRLHVVPASFGWSDVGSWLSAWELSDKDAAGNAGPNTSIFIDASGNLVQDLRSDAKRKAVALVGIRDACVIVTDDALLVLPKERGEDVRLVVEELARRGPKDLL